MCAQSSQYHFGQGKTLQNPTKPVFLLRNPGEIRKIRKKQKTNPHMGLANFPIQPYFPGLVGVTLG